MSENTCPNVALSRNQNMWVVKESADKTLEFPAVADIINVTSAIWIWKRQSRWPRSPRASTA